jgi:hypothetical protein
LREYNYKLFPNDEDAEDEDMPDAEPEGVLILDNVEDDPELEGDAVISAVMLSSQGLTGNNVWRPI